MDEYGMHEFDVEYFEDFNVDLDVTENNEADRRGDFNMDKQELKVSKDQFDKKKKELKEIGKGIQTNYKMEKVKTSGDNWFGWGDHKVTGAEMNDFIVVVQKYFTKIGETDNKIIKEFQKVYDTFDALDKEYINGIVGNMKTLEEKCIDIKNKFDVNNMSMTELLKELVKTKSRLDEAEIKTKEQTRIINEQEKKGIERDKAIALGKKKDAEHDKKLKVQAEKDFEHDKAIAAGEKRDAEQDKLLKAQAEKDLEHDKAISAGKKRDAEQDKLLKAQAEKDLEHDKAIAEESKKIADHEKRIKDEEKMVAKLLQDIESLREQNKNLESAIVIMRRDANREKWRRHTRRR